MTPSRAFGPFTPAQRRMLERLDDGPAADSVGAEAEQLSRRQIAACERLVGLDLARFDVGWRYSCWFRLTPAGRDALRALRAEAAETEPERKLARRSRLGSRKTASLPSEPQTRTGPSDGQT